MKFNTPVKNNLLTLWQSVLGWWRKQKYPEKTTNLWQVYYRQGIHTTDYTLNKLSSWDIKKPCFLKIPIYQYLRWYQSLKQEDIVLIKHWEITWMDAVYTVIHKVNLAYMIIIQFLVRNETFLHHFDNLISLFFKIAK